MNETQLGASLAATDYLASSFSLDQVEKISIGKLCLKSRASTPCEHDCEITFSGEQKSTLRLSGVAISTLIESIETGSRKHRIENPWKQFHFKYSDSPSSLESVKQLTLNQLGICYSNLFSASPSAVKEKAE